jgi:hypothetical protein
MSCIIFNLERDADDTKQVCQVGTPSAECCSKSKFFPREKLVVNIELSGNSRKITVAIKHKV